MKDARTQTTPWLGGDIEQALGDVGVPSFVVDRHGVIRWRNAAATEQFGDVLGSHFSSRVAPEARPTVRIDFVKKLLGTSRATVAENVLLDSSGARVAAEVHTVALGDGGHVVGVFGLVRVHETAAARPSPAAELTPRQHEVLRLLAHGASTTQIAESLGVSRETVRNHVRAILRSLHVHSRLEAVAEAYRRGLAA
jgi:DNA-binding CsgD family transcriptional regulator